MLKKLLSVYAIILLMVLSLTTALFTPEVYVTAEENAEQPMQTQSLGTENSDDYDDDDYDDDYDYDYDDDDYDDDDDDDDIIGDFGFVTDITVSPGGNVNVIRGKTFKFTATVTGYGVYTDGVNWTVQGNKSDGTTVSADGTLTVASNETATTMVVTAISKEDGSVSKSVVVNINGMDHMINVSANPSAGGSVTGGGTVKDGSNIVLYQSANNNYRFTGWYENNKLVSTTSQLALNNVTSDHTIVAAFERTTCNVSVKLSDGAAGSVTGAGTVAYKGSVTLTAKANPGYNFVGFIENNQMISTNATTTLTNITTDRNITAQFKAGKYTVNLSVSPANTGSVTGGGTFDDNAKVVIKATPANGYAFYAWTLNGQVFSTDPQFTIDKIQTSYNIVANFIPANTATVNITSSAGAGGGIAPVGTTKVTLGGRLSYSIVPTNGYRIADVVVDGKSVGAVTTYTFSDVRADHTIAATFAAASANDSGNYTAQNGGGTPKPQGNAADEEETTHGTETNPLIIHTQNAEIAAATYGVLDDLGLSEDEARTLIRGNNDLALLKMAFESGDLQLTVNSDYADSVQETSEALYYHDPSLKNFEEVMDSTLSEEEKIALLKGGKVSFNVSIVGNKDTVTKADKKLIEQQVGYKAVDYFDYVIMKSFDGQTSMLTQTSTELETSIKVPEELRSKNREYSILRIHNGEVDVLPDLDSDPDTITFRSGKFSQYAIVYKAVNVNVLSAVFLGITVLSLLIAMICFVNLIKYKRTARRARKQYK